jgi:hypothetical protein
MTLNILGSNIDKFREVVGRVLQSPTPLDPYTTIASEFFHVRHQDVSMEMRSLTKTLILPLLSSKESSNVE